MYIVRHPVFICKWVLAILTIQKKLKTKYYSIPKRHQTTREFRQAEFPTPVTWNVV